MSRTPELQSRRLILRAWCDADGEAFAALNADPRVMEHFPAVLSRSESDALLARLRESFDERGFGLWAVEAPDVAPLIGFVGLSVPRFEASFTPCVEIGWRLAWPYWGQGYASEGARAALAFAFETLCLEEVLSWTVPANGRSRSVMQALGMTHAPADDFDHPNVSEGHRLRRHVLYRLPRGRWAQRAGGGGTRSTTLDRSRALAAALDSDEFERARPLLSPDCTYEVRGAVLRGADAILRSYADATRSAHSQFDAVRYESEVAGTEAEARIHYTDVLQLGGREHRHRCVQHLTFDADGLITRIVHEDLAGEREAVRSFLEQCEARRGRCFSA